MEGGRGWLQVMGGSRRVVAVGESLGHPLSLQTGPRQVGRTTVVEKAFTDCKDSALVSRSLPVAAQEQTVGQGPVQLSLAARPGPGLSSTRRSQRHLLCRLGHPGDLAIPWDVAAAGSSCSPLAGAPP